MEMTSDLWCEQSGTGLAVMIFKGTPLGFTKDLGQVIIGKPCMKYTASKWSGYPSSKVEHVRKIYRNKPKKQPSRNQ